MAGVGKTVLGIDNNGTRLWLIYSGVGRTNHFATANMFSVNGHVHQAVTANAIVLHARLMWRRYGHWPRWFPPQPKCFSRCQKPLTGSWWFLLSMSWSRSAYFPRYEPEWLKRRMMSRGTFAQSLRLYFELQQNDQKVASAMLRGATCTGLFGANVTVVEGHNDARAF